MPGIHFKFGVRGFFNFTFNLQLGPSPALKDEPSQHRASPTQETISATEQSSSVPDPTTNNCQQSQQQEVSGPRSNPPLQSILDAQIYAEQYAAQHSHGNPVAPAIDAGPIRSSLSANTERNLTADTPTSIPQTPKFRATPHHSHRPRPKTRFYSLYSAPRSSRPLPRPRLKLPPIEAFSKPLPSPPSSTTPGTPCTRPLSFQTLPLEIKHMIYSELLVSAEPIRKPHKLVCNKRSIMLDSIQPVKDIDSSVLRVCRTMYSEALPVLYGKNTFEFCKPRKLRDFSHAGLDRSHTIQGTDFIPFLAEFGFRDAEAGRFTLIRSIILRLGHDRKPYVWQRPGGQPAPDRKRIWSHWYQYFFNDCDPRSQFDWGMFPSASNEFPALDKLELDFTDWQLSEPDAIRVDPFLKKLGRSGGLGALAIKGVKNAANLEEFRKGLLKAGGVFTVKN
ncbi:MAG: hypothetical protein Q9166_001847 [cf. Caloplaca sp. 2 TL-2023]